MDWWENMLMTTNIVRATNRRIAPQGVVAFLAGLSMVS
jgi:hypothetical protein